MRRSLGFVVVSFLVIFAIDLYAPSWSVPVPVWSLYAIPILMAAWIPSPMAAGAVGAFTVLAVAGKGYATDALYATVLSFSPAMSVAGVLSYRHAKLRVELLQHQKSHQRALSDADVAIQRLQQYLEITAHDLAQPLTILLGYVQFVRRRLEARGLASEAQALLAAERAARRMRRLVHDLRDASQASTGRFAIHVAETDVVALAQQVIGDQEVTGTGHQIRMVAPESLVGQWDAERLYQLFANLISNAVKFSPRGSEVRVELAQEGHALAIRVSDQGPGIPAAQQDRLFQPFSRLGDSGSVHGTGLGLYICRAIVEAHGGRIWVRSDVGRGSTFHVVLPLHSEPR